MAAGMVMESDGASNSVVCRLFRHCSQSIPLSGRTRSKNVETLQKRGQMNEKVDVLVVNRNAVIFWAKFKSGKVLGRKVCLSFDTL